MTQLRESIFDKSFREAGIYFLVLKNGFKIAFSKRSEVWKDKANAQFCTLSLLKQDDLPQKVIDFIRDNEFIHGEKVQIDIRYNDVSCVWECF